MFFSFVPLYVGGNFGVGLEVLFFFGVVLFYIELSAFLILDLLHELIAIIISLLSLSSTDLQLHILVFAALFFDGLVYEGVLQVFSFGEGTHVNFLILSLVVHKHVVILVIVRLVHFCRRSISFVRPIFLAQPFR